jgi:hypothetical protein
MTKLLLLSLFIGYGSRIQSHVGIGTGCSTLRQGSWVDDEDTFDDLTTAKPLEVQHEVLRGRTNLHKRWKHTRCDENIRPDVPPISQFQIAGIHHPAYG